MLNNLIFGNRNFNCTSMISIITAVHNLLPMNRLFLEMLKKHTRNPFELIIIDNNSTDGSREFFQEHADRVILNSDNYSYPYCQNQGIGAARYDFLAFFNNDIVVSEGWDEKIIEIMDEQGIEVISFATNDYTESRRSQKKIQRRFKWAKYPVKAVVGLNRWSLKLMLFLTYGNFSRFCERRYRKFGNQTVEGYSGSSILMKRSALEKVGRWDERIQKADFELFNRVKVRSLEKRDILPVQLATGIYFHHYKKLTNRYSPFADADNLITLSDKWGERTGELRRDIVR